jgi:outer membrane protein OmpA-like peptidoglycan-associated protein
MPAKIFNIFSSAAMVVVLFALLAAPSRVAGQIRQGAAFLQFTPGAREQGIAGSLSGVIDDVHAIYANPGAAGFMREWQWSATYSQWIAEVYSASLLYGKRIRTPWSGNSRFALGLAYQGVGDFNSTAQPGVSASANDLVAALSFGQPLSRRLALGTNVKYLRSKLAQYDASSWMVDAGLLWRSARFRFLNTGKNFLDHGIFSAGVAVTQLGQPLTFITNETPLPRTVRGGVAFNTGSHHGLQLHFTVDYKKARDQRGFASFGSEISWNQILAVRGGYDFNDCLLSHFSFGLTLRLDDRNTFAKALPGPNQALRFDVAAVEDNFLFARTYRGSVTHHAIDPEGFEFISPLPGAFIKSDSVLLAWEAAQDPDLYDDVNYWLIVERDSLKLAEVINTAKRNDAALFNALENSKFFITRKPDGTTFQLTDLEGGDYFWMVMAYDRDRHVRFASKDQRQIQHFRIAGPDVEITGITFDYHPWITDDDLQGTLHFTIKNSGDGAAKNISFMLSDSLAASTNGVAANQSSIIPQLNAGAVDTIKMEWRTPHAGLHRLTAQLDAGNRLRERDKNNNQRHAEFYTIPKGRFTTADTALVLKQLRLSYETPFIAEVCFDSNSAAIKADYLHKSILEPPLATLAQRLRGNRDLKIYLQGFVDPNSGENDADLAEARAGAVQDSLLALGVYREQIQILPGQVIPLRRQPRDATDARWVMQERRYVGITAETNSESVLFQLVAFNLNEPLPAPVIFNAAIAGAVPLGHSLIQLESGTLRKRIDLSGMAQGASLQQDISWQPEDEVGATWVGRDASYELILTDDLGRQFRTKPRQTYLAAQSLLREQRVAWPIKFRGTEPLYDFYWTKLMVHVNRMLEDKNMRMRFAGHACAIGPEPVNMLLSKQRAEAFREGFVRHIKTRYPETYERIMERLDAAVGYGETRPLTLEYINGERRLLGDHEKPLGRKLNRRLEIEFYYPKEKSSNFSDARRQPQE